MRSERRACQLVGIHRSVIRYQANRHDDAGLHQRLKALISVYPRYGGAMLHVMLKAEGLVVNAQKTYRIYREEP